MLRGVNVCLGVCRSVIDLDIPVALSSVALTSARPLLYKRHQTPGVTIAVMMH